MLAFVALFDALAALTLYPHLDLFSIGYLAISTLLAVVQTLVSRRLSSSEEIRRFFYAKDIDKAWDIWVPILGVAEFAVFFEYAHWRPIPEVVNRFVQSSGLLLAIAGAVWLFWVDAYLVEQFPTHYKKASLMVSGPYRILRHPRYAGLLTTRLALPLIFGSLIACLIAIVWVLLIRRRTRLEEQYLTEKFGASYTEYASRTLGIP